MNRTVLKVAGESGMGLLSVGRIATKVLKHMGFYIYSDREYPSLIKGGHSNLQIDFGLQPIHSLSSQVDLVIALDLMGLVEYLETVKEGGILIHCYDRADRIRGLKEKAEARNVNMIYYPALPTARELGGKDIMMNTVMLGLLWRVFGFDLDPLKIALEEQFSKKPKLLPLNIKCIEAGYAAEKLDQIPELTPEKPTEVPDTLLMDGNMAVALGAVRAGVRAHYQYPMSPSSSILTHLANFSNETKMLVKQAEDEITAAQLAFGSMFAGTRAMTATSGGGFDLMSETVSLAGITETPWVCVLCQRPGPGTGLPTWTAQGDLNLALYAGHGEFARLVLAASDPASAYELTQHAFNYSEEFQVPTVLLSEKVICEAQTLVPPLNQEIPIKRGLVESDEDLMNLKSTDRFKITEDGVSKRWIPGSAPVGYYGNGDEHREDGTLTEKAEEAAPMYAKRIRKLDTLKAALPEPILYGDSDATVTVVGWGSTKGVVLDAIQVLKQKGVSVSYLHFDYLWPLKTEKLNDLFKSDKRVVLLENNYLGQFGNLIEMELQHRFDERFLKYDGRPFFLEEVTDFLEGLLNR